jgi:hypothetical protein
MTATTTESTSPAPAVEEETDSAEAWTTPAANPAFSAIPVPAPVLAPYLGLVASVLCALGGGWLLLAPYALDIRRGAAKLPRAAAVELETGAAIVAVAVSSGILFAAALFSRLRPRFEGAEFEMEAEPVPPGLSETESVEPEIESEAEPEPESESPIVSAGSDSSSALREMLTPLVAALAADLRSQDQARQHGRSQDGLGQPSPSQPSPSEHSPSEHSGDQRTRQEP